MMSGTDFNTETEFEENPDLERKCGASVAIVERNPHHSATLLVTCTLQDDNDQLRQHEEGCEVGDGGSCQRESGTYEGGNSNALIEDWDEDVLFVMDF